MENKSKLHEWLRKASPQERRDIAKQAGVKLHYLQRLARGEISDPGLNSARCIINAVNAYTTAQPDSRGFFQLGLDDIK